MTAITDAGNDWLRDHLLDLPSLPLSKPEKAKGRVVIAMIDAALSSLGITGAVTVKKATKAELDLDLAYAAGTLALVWNDPTVDLRGIYAKAGASGTGSWANTGIALPASFVADLYAALQLKVDDSQIDVDPTFAADSDTRIPSQKAVKAYMDAFLAANDAMVFKGVIDCSANPNYPAADQGWVYRVSADGKIGGASGVTVEAGDMLICKTDGTASGTQAAVGASWSVIALDLSGALALAIPATRETDARLAGRAPLPCGPVDLTSLFTKAPEPYGRIDGNTSITGFDTWRLIGGEDGVMHALNKHDLSVMRVDREPDWTLADPWQVALTSKADPAGVDSPNTFLRGSARETWVYEHLLEFNVTTGYAIVVGSGDLSDVPGVYRAPSVFFWREGASAAQSLTQMLATAGIMGGVTSSPRCLMGVARTATDTFFLCGSGWNQSTNPAPSRPTFGRMVLTLNGSKTETGATAVTSLTWTDYLSNLQAAMPVGETIVNVPAVADQLVSGVLYVMVVTKDGGAVLRARLVQFTVGTATAALDDLEDAASEEPKFPVTPINDAKNQIANVCVSPTGIAWTIQGVDGVLHAGFRANADAVWRNISNQLWRALGKNGMGAYALTYDADRSRFVVAGGFDTRAALGWLDSLCKQGRPYSRAFPAPLRYEADVARCARGVWTDAQGTSVVGDRQLVMFLPDNSVEPPPTRVLWGLRVTPHADADTVTVSEGEAVIYQDDGTPQRVHFAGGAYASPGWASFTVVLNLDGTVARPGNGFFAGLDYPEPALWEQCLLATVEREATGVIAPEEISVTFRDQ